MAATDGSDVRIVVVGLGPAGADLLLPAARAAIERSTARFVRTARHPAVDDLRDAGIELESFDAIYDAAPSLDAAYATIVERLVDAARRAGAVVYAVPGSPVVAERTTMLLRARDDVELTVIPGISFADLAWARVGVDPMARETRVLDARDVRAATAGAQGALLLAQADSALVLSEVKLALLDSLKPEHPVTVLQRLGRPDEHVVTLVLEELDRGRIEPDHLTSVFVDTGDERVGAEMVRLLELTETLRGPGGCPWDAKQTHHSLARHLLEEAYETVEAIERLPIDAPKGDEEPAPGSYEAVEDELGDVLFQVFIHSVLAAEAGAFTVADVARGIHEKLVRRHPHVFGDVNVETADEVVRNWEQLKKTEKQTTSLVDGLPENLPALLYTPKLYRKAAAIGIDPSDEQPDQWLEAALARLEAAPRAETSDALGEVLAAAVAVARARDVDAESALRGWAGRFKQRIRELEERAEREGVDLEHADAETVRALWATTNP
jgi:tetrapyrrole methylase family protein/MazG family protein